MKKTVTGELRLEDMQRHVPIPFEVPEGMAEIAIDFDFNPKHPGSGDIPHEISLSLWDPQRGRGARHNNPDFRVRVGQQAATPGFEPGPIPAGTWTLFIDTHRILPPGDLVFSVEIEARREVSMAPQNYTTGVTADRGPGWYRGDLHGHTFHSDAQWDVAAYVAHQRRQGLDFTTLTDHNTVSGLPELAALADDGMLTLGGVELTTFRGHCLALGPRTFRDWRVQDGETMAERARAHMEAGALFVIAHPMAPGHPFCSGCNWQYTDMMPGIAPAVEIWNGPWDLSSNNPLSLDLFYGWLNDGHRLVATAGSDVHGPWGENESPGYNIVEAEALREDAIWAAIRAGHLYLSDGPELIATAEHDGQAFRMGDTAPGLPLDLKIRWAGGSRNCAICLVTGEIGMDAIRRRRVADAGMDGALDVALVDDADWVVVEMRDAANQLRAITNPIFVEADRREV